MERKDRKAAKFTDTWVAEFSILAQGTWSGISVSGVFDSVVVSYLDTGVTEKQQRDFKVFLANRRHEQIIPWLISSIKHLKSETMTQTWMEQTDFHKDLKFICNINIIAVLNFPSETTELPPKAYPLAFMLA